MIDREVLELASLAAGHKLEWYIPKAGSDEPHIDGCDWNPLTDDGDALRLAVKLNFKVECQAGGQVYVWWYDDLIWNEFALHENNEDEMCAATQGQ